MHSKIRQISLPASLIALAITPNAAIAEEALPIEEIVVSATRMGGTTDVATKVSLLSQETLTNQLALSTDLSTVLSSQLPSYAPSRQKMSSRGETLRGREPLMMVDGIPQSNPLRDGDRTAHTISPLLLDRVEVIHSANSIHGLGASGGTVNLVTKTPGEGIEQTIRFNANGQNHSDSVGGGVNYLLSAGFEQADLLFAVDSKKQGYFYDGHDNQVGSDTTQGDAQDSESDNYFLKLGYNFSEESRLQFTLSHYNQANQGHLIPLNVGVEGNDTNTTISIESDQPWTPAETQVDMQALTFDHAITQNTELKIQAYHQDFYAIFGGGCWSDFYDPNYDPITHPEANTVACGNGNDGENYFYDQSRNNSEKQGVKLSMLSDLGDLQVGYGIDVGQDITEQDMVQTDRSWVPESTYNSIGVYVQAEWQLNYNTMLSAGIRQEEAELKIDDYHTLYGYGDADIEGGTKDYSETLFNIGLNYSINDALSFRTSFSEGFGMPDVGRALRYPAPGETSVNDFLTLEPVVTDNIELGFDYDTDLVSANITVFQSSSDFGNTLTFIEDGNGEGGHYILKRQPTEYRGLELNSSFYVTDIDTIKLAYALNRGTEEIYTDGAYQGDKDLTGANAGLDRLLLSWSRDWKQGWRSSIQASHVFDRTYNNEIGSEFAQFDGYTLVDVMASKTIHDVRLQVGVQNLFDEFYLSYFSQTEKAGKASQQFAGMGRNWSVTATYQF